VFLESAAVKTILYEYISRLPNVTPHFYVQQWMYYAVRVINVTRFIIPCIILNTCLYYSTELYEPGKRETRWRMLRDKGTATARPNHLSSLTGFPFAHAG
jgi:hypothetical protein